MKSVIVFFFMFFTRNALGASYDTEWWKHTDIYELDVGGFKDHDGDGFGDLQGLISRLNYVKELGFQVIKLSPLCSSTDLIVPQYGIEDFRKIHLAIGDMQDLEELMKKAESEGIKVILDFMINDCSTSHEWFEMSRQRIDPYTDYFIWRDLTEEERETGTTSSNFWTLDKTRQQLYYSRENYFAKVADLNFRNELVKQEVKELIKFWLDKGVAGLNLLGASQYIEDPLIMESMYPESNLTQNCPESYEFIHELREFVDKYSKQKGDYQRILIVENMPNEKYDNLRGNETYPIAHILSSDVFQQVIYEIFPPYTYYGSWRILYNSKENLNLLKHITEEVKKGPSLFVSESSESRTRLGSRFEDPQLLNTWIMSMAMSPGVFHMFYGQEIGLENFQSRNRYFRRNYPYGSSMHWDDSINAGFTKSNFAMVPPNVNYWAVNVEKYENEKFSTLHMVKDLLKLRKTKAVIYGDLKTHNISEFVFAFTRSYEDKESYFTIFNFANVPYRVSLNAISNHLPNRVSVAAATPNASYQKGDEVATELPLELRPASGMVLDVIDKRK